MVFHFRKKQTDADDTQDSIEYEEFLKQQKEKEEARKKREREAAAQREREEAEKRDAEEDNGQFGLNSLV